RRIDGLPRRGARPDDAKWCRPFIGEADGASRRRRRRPIWQGSGYELAAGAERLIAAGHNPGEVMNYTPRQLQAFLIIAQHRRKTELREQLHVNALAARADEKTIRGQLRDWEN